ncbi:hypothetical protein [Streptomyces sp. NRRL S-337]|uniref:hypothetical protein n=1 Tax=Streptomyces sp. NRRL S-337 TaxID=1463900 RepID=UPI00131D58B4|nr:hypothetical protein [Streptomyces sp. NRRL S-337]
MLLITGPAGTIGTRLAADGLDAIETKDTQRSKTVEITGLNDPSAQLHGTLSGELAASR